MRPPTSFTERCIVGVHFWTLFFEYFVHILPNFLFKIDYHSVKTLNIKTYKAQQSVLLVYGIIREKYFSCKDYMLKLRSKS